MNLRISIAAAVTTSLISGGALAAPTDPGVTTSSAAYPGSVTISEQSTPTTYLALVVTLNNNGGSAVRMVSATGVVKRTKGLTAPTFYVPASDARCTQLPTADGFDFACNVLSAEVSAGSTSDIVVVVSVPKYDATGGSSDDVCSDQTIKLTSTTSWREGNSLTGNSIASSTDVRCVAVDAQSPTSVKSAVVKKGLDALSELYTGNSIPKSGDPQTTKVIAPGLDALTTSLSFIKVEVTETPAQDAAEAASCANARTFKTCWKTQLLARDDKNNHVRYKWGSYLTQVIRSNTDNQQPGNPKNFIWYYVSDTGVQSTINQNTSTDFCPKDSSTGLVAPNYTIVNGAPVATGVPCLVAPPVCYKKGDTLEGVLLSNGVCEWRFINDRNGLIKGYF